VPRSDGLARLQRGEDKPAVRWYLDGDRDEIDRVVADHRQGIGEPARGAERFRRFLRTLLVARRHRGELEIGKALDRRNVGDLRPARPCVRADDSDPDHALAHDRLLLSDSRSASSSARCGALLRIIEQAIQRAAPNRGARRDVPVPSQGLR
jgi:hypothetical protein